MPLHSKAAAITAAKDFLKMVRMQHDVHVIGWMSDASGEYKSDLFDRALLEKGIKIYQSAPRTPMQNGCAKRLKRTLMDKAESMRHQACIPDSWWEFVFTHATHIYNHTPVARLQWRTPHEMLKGEMPNIDHLRVFGCGAFVYLPATARANKMAPKLELMTYVGVAPGNECNFLFMCSTNAVFTAAHAIFDKHHFPRCPKNRCEPLENPFGRANPKPATDRPGTTPDDIDSDDDVEHDHGYPHPHAVETCASLGAYLYIRACLARSYGAQVPMHTGGALAHAGLPIGCACISPTELQPSIHVSSSFSHPQQCRRAQYSPSLHPHYSAQPPTLLAHTSSPTRSHMRSVAPCEGPASVHSLYLSLCALQSLGTTSGCLCLLALLSTAMCALHVHSRIC